MVAKLKPEEPNQSAVRPASSADAGLSHLLGCGDPIMSALVRRIGPLDREAFRRGRPDDAYGSLVRSILGQQLSTSAARTIYRHLCGLYGDRPPTPRELLATEESDLRAAGISRQKAGYLRNLSEHVLEGELDLDALDRLADEEVIARLTAVKGLGRWSAEMFLIFHLKRPDVLSVGDVGIRRAVREAYGLPVMPAPDELRLLAEPWRPQRTLASLYLWESLR